VMRQICHSAYKTSVSLAEERGPFRLFDRAKYLDRPFVKHRLTEDIKAGINRYGIRNGVLLTIAPTGTISLVFGNTSSGCEPVFEHVLNRKVLQETGQWREYTAYGYGLAVYHASKDAALGTLNLPSHMVSTNQLSIGDHIRIQAACQEFVDASVSKTINCRPDMEFEEFKTAYTMAYDLGCKGCTTYRPSEIRGSILSAPKSESKIHVSLEERPDILSGKTYKIKWPTLEGAFYVTVNDNNGKPFEMFISSKGAAYDEWTIALTRMISALMRLTGDITFIHEELQQISSAHNQAFVGGRRFPSIVAYIGYVLQQHMDQLKERGSSNPKVTAPPTSTTGAALQRTSDVCPRCTAATYIRSEGCGTCTSCGYSTCG